MVETDEAVQEGDFPHLARVQSIDRGPLEQGRKRRFSGKRHVSYQRQ